MLLATRTSLSQRCKWVLVDADYENSLAHLLKLQWELKNEHRSCFGKKPPWGQLWIFAEPPLLAKDCRIYIDSLAMRLKLPVKGAKSGTNAAPIVPPPVVALPESRGYKSKV